MYRLIRNKNFWLGLVIIIVLFGLINKTSANRKDITVAENLIRTIYTPLQSGVNEFSDFMGQFGTIFAEKNTLSRQLKSLEQKNNQLKLENQVLREDQAELQRLRNIVQFKDNHALLYDLIPARILARSPNNWYKTLTIDKGSRQGVKKDMAVISPDGLVGRISEVNENASQVFLMTDREVAVGAILQETRETNGIVEGLGDSYFLRMKNIPYYSSVKKGDRVITSGLSEYYPKGITIGYIKKYSREPGGLLISATVVPTVDFNKLEEVLVVSAYRPPVFKEPTAQEE